MLSTNATLLLVSSAIAAAAQYFACYPGRSIAVLREAHGVWLTARQLPFDNASALAPHLLDGALTPFSDEDVERLRPLLSAADSTERPLRHRVRLV